MNSNTPVRLGAFALVASLVLGAAPAASADEIEPAPTPVVSLSQPDVLTLPDGDGVRDTATIDVTADLATTIDLAVLASDGTTVLATLPSVVLTDDLLTQTITVPVTGLPAGSLLLQATPAGGAAQTVTVRVGSGVPTAAALKLSPSTIYTWSKSTARTSKAAVTATDETGLTVPFAGTVTVTAGKVTRKAAVASKTGAAATASISVSGLPVGTARVTASVSAGGAPAVASPAASLVVKTVAISSTKVAASSTTLYPTKDGYRDAAKLSVSSKTTTGAAVPVTGTVTITRSGKKIKTWKLTSSKAWSATWDGKVSGKVVPGTYTVTVAVKGPQGDTKKSTTKIAVKKGKLVTRTYTKTYTAKSVLKEYYTYDEWDEGYCVFDRAGQVGCQGYDAAYNADGVSLLSVGTVSLPSAAVSAQKYGAAKVRVSLTASVLSGSATWSYTAAGRDFASASVLKKGTATRGWLTLPATTKKVDIAVAADEYSSFIASKIKVEYSYKVLVTS